MSKTLEDWAGASRTTLALAVTDIVGSTGHGVELGDEKWAELLIRHFEQARKLLSKYDCYEIKIIGDSFMVAFRTAIEALNFAFDFHEATGDENIRIRAGIHVGPARVINNDLYGSMVNYTFRVIGSLADEGIVLSSAAKEHIELEWGRRSAIRTVEYSTELKGFNEPQRLWRVWKITAIAVLPFRSLMGESSAGVIMADALIIRLNKIEGILVRPTGSINKYSVQEQDPLAAGREQYADFVVDGTIQQAGERTTVTARLLRVKDGEVLWAERYEGCVNHTSETEVSIAEQVVRKLKLSVTTKERERLAKRYTESPEAYEEYKWGRYFRNKFTEKDLHEAIKHFQEAIRFDANYGKAYAGVADCFIWLGIYNFLSPKETFAKAKEWADDALKIDSTLASAHTSLAFTKMFYEWDWAGAEREFKQAIELNPNFATAHQGYSMWLTALGWFDDALAKIQQALEVDPTSFIINVSKGIILYVAQRYDQSLEQFGKLVTLNPEFDPAYYGLALAYGQKGMHKEAIDAAEKAVEHSHHHPLKIAALAHAHAMSGEKEMALRELKTLNRWRARPNHFVSPFHIALIYAAINEVDETFRCLQEACAVRDQWLFLMCVEPRLKGLKEDERFKGLLEEIRLRDCLSNH